MLNSSDFLHKKISKKKNKYFLNNSKRMSIFNYGRKRYFLILVHVFYLRVINFEKCLLTHFKIKLYTYDGIL